ncbi:MAG: 50S ribosomal protein L11 methyltransferase [Rikenellaceae bacterium]
MDYFEYFFETPSEQSAEIVMAELAEVGFESFEQDEQGVKCYITSVLESQFRDDIEQLVQDLGFVYYKTKIEAQNWNALWESNFPEIDVDGRCLIRAPFHDSVEGYEHEVVIMPKMSFGTGHHATTFLMVCGILDGGKELFDGALGLDMGSGTGVLAILAAKLGAQSVDAIDIDEWAYENCGENIEQNGVSGLVTPILGDASTIEGRSYDFILANINRNILLNDLRRYAATLVSGGVILLSGILQNDIQTITNKCAEVGVSISSKLEKDGWAMLKGVKN